MYVRRKRVEALHNGLRLSGIRAHHVLASSGWPGANGHSTRVLGTTALGRNARDEPLRAEDE
jgi:hypothetical protein